MFKAQMKIPESGNKYYNRKDAGGYSSAILGNPVCAGLNVLSNCVGYAYGRFNEIAGAEDMRYLQPRNAELFVKIAESQGLEVGSVPKLGACAVWQKGATLSGEDGAGHVAIVEQIISETEIVTSESGYGCTNPFWTQNRKKGGGNWGQDANYKFLGFIYNPAISDAENCPYKVPKKIVRKGDNGDGVKWLQWHLAQRGYLRTSEIDGDFGKITLGAVLAYQLENKLEVDGVCGAVTRAALALGA